MANKITVLLDLVTDKATSAAKGFKSSIADAEGSVGKFRAGASSAFATVQANAGALALAGGTAIAAFGAKSVAAFQDTALAAGKLSDATGLTVQDASRLQEVAGDLGVSTDALAGSLVRMQKAVASNSDAVKELGIEVHRTKDGQVDVNATFLDAVAKLGTVTDANKKAQLASQLFGKGFADSAELILGNADDIKKRLDEVSGAQVISDKQLARARKFRDQMDDVADSLKQVELTIGDQLVPVIGALAEALVFAEDKAKDLNNVLSNLPGDFSLGGINRGDLGAFGLFVRAAKDVKDRFDGGSDSVETFAGQVDRMADSVNAAVPDLAELSDEAQATADAAAEAAEHTASLGDKAANSGPKIGDMAGALEDARQNLADLNEEARNNALDILAAAAKGVADAVDSAFTDLTDQLDLGDLLDDITEQFGAVQEAAKDLSGGGEEAARNYRDEVRRLQRELVDLVQKMDNIPPQKKVEILAKIATGDLDTLNTALDDIIGKDRFVHVGLIMPNLQQAFSGVNVTVAPGGGGNSPTFLNQNPQPGAVDNSQTTIIYPVGSSPTTTFIDQRLYQTRNGTNPR